MESKDYKRRMQSHGQELYEKYMSLYHDDRSYEELYLSMEQFYQNRSEELKELDLKREQNPDWFRDRNMLGMTMYPPVICRQSEGLD